MDIVRLAIIYDTQQAASRLNDLNTRLGSTHTSSRKLASAAVGLAQSLQTGSISAQSLTSHLGLLGGKAGAVGLTLAVVAGILLLVKRNSDAARAQTEKFADQLRQTKRAVDDLFRVGPKSEFRGELEQINDQIRDLDRQLGKQRMNLIDRLFGGFKFPSIGRFLFGGEDPETRRQRNALGGQAGRLTPEAQRTLISDRASFDRGTDRALARLFQSSEIDKLGDSLDRSRKELRDLIEAGLDPMSESAQGMADSILQGEQALRTMTRAADLLKGGLDIISGAIEDFVVTGTVAFTDFLNNILRLLYQSFTGDIIDSILRGAFAVKGGGTAGTGHAVAGFQHGGIVPGVGPQLAVVHGGEEIVPFGRSAGVATSVTFNVHAMDAQSVATFFDRNGGAIAAQVARQADRSRAVRRRLSR